MDLSRLAQCLVVVACLAQTGCQTRVEGDYQLDLEQTKVCVAKIAAADPEEAKGKDGALKVLEVTKVDIRLEAGGKMLSTTVITWGGAPATSKVNGTWKLDAKRVTIKVQDDADTICDVDGSRLRCHKDAYNKLFGDYVLKRK